MTYTRNIPDDFRRDYHDLRGLIEMGTYYPDEDGGPDVFHATLSPRRAQEIEARLKKLPENTIIVQTGRGRYQITVGDDLTIIALDVGKVIILEPSMSNQIKISQRFS